MSAFSTAITAGLATVRQITGMTVTISSAGQTGAPITAGVGSTEYEIDDGGAVIETWTSRDYLILATDYAPAGAPALPQKGDIISETIAGAVRQFAVLAPQGKPVFEFSDRNRGALRVHTKEVA